MSKTKWMPTEWAAAPDLMKCVAEDRTLLEAIADELKDGPFDCILAAIGTHLSNNRAALAKARGES